MNIYVGSYTNSIFRFNFDAQTGKITDQEIISGLENPSYIALSPGKDYLYAVEEISDFQNQSTGAVSSFKIDHKTQEVKLLNSQSTYGGHPCYLSIDQTGKWLLVANYSGGNISVLPILKNGIIGPATDTINFNKSNDSNYSHPHCIYSNNSTLQSKELSITYNTHNLLTIFNCKGIVHEPIGNFVFIADCGLDQIYIYKLNTENGKLAPHSIPSINLPQGTGPRHLEFHKDLDICYSVNETDLTITTYKYDHKLGNLNIIQNLSILPRTKQIGDSAADIHIHPSGKFVYTSSRGHDSIAIFSVNQDGTLESNGYQSSGGKIPRGFGIDPTGHWLLVANQESDNIVSFKIDQTTGELTEVSKAEVKRPTCIKFT